MYYIIQENTWKETHYDILIEMMGRYNMEYEIVKYRPFIHDIDVKTDRKDVFCFGAIAMVALSEKYGWKPGTMLNSNHDFEVYAEKFGMENMLNGDGKVIKFTDPVPFDDEIFFIRPTKDTKLFTGQLFTQDSWKKYVDETDRNNVTEIIKLESNMLVSPAKNIQQEVRCWVVDGKVITASRYKLGSRVIYQNYDHESLYVDFAQSMVDKFQVADAFVIDVCLAYDELKVVEVNCINSAGFYHCDVNKLLEALENKFGSN